MLLLPALAWAHRPGLSYVHLGHDGIVVTFAQAELADRIPLVDLSASRVLLDQATLGRLTVSVGGTHCSYGLAEVAAVEGDGVSVSATMDCPAGDVWTIQADYFAELTPGHRTLVDTDSGAAAVLDAAHARAELEASAGPLGLAARFTELGVEHIWTGYDHLAFLFGLVLIAGRLRDMLLIVTGFTVAHSITLSLAATGVFDLPPALVEPLIAASILFVGVENLWRPPARRRVVVTFLLGLIHGFGFAGLLAEIGIPPNSLLLALGTFNLGVELGQAAVVVVALPVLLALRRLPAWERYFVPSLSVLVALSGLGWLLERTVFAAG